MTKGVVTKYILLELTKGSNEFWLFESVISSLKSPPTIMLFCNPELIWLSKYSTNICEASNLLWKPSLQHLKWTLIISKDKYELNLRNKIETQKVKI